jgi:DNA-binding CsgD family transcriptional regulator
MLRGRGPEQAVIDGLLGGVREGGSGVLVIRGEPGIGKTALLEYAVGQADAMRLLRCAGIESEAELPFAGLHQLLRPVLERLDALPGVQQRALSGAFGLDVGGDGDRFIIGAGVLSLLSDVAEDAPLLCLVDDAQWLDRASAEALLFAARRLDRDGIVILFATRDYPDAGLPQGGLRELRLGGLGTRAAAELLDDAGVALPIAVRDQLVADTQGNPLALLELPSVMSGPRALPGLMPLTSRVLDAFHHQIRSLPAVCQTALLLAAADDTGELTLLACAADDLATSIADLQEAERRGLISLAAGTPTFRHPLIRAAAYQGAPLGERIAVHRALAAAYARHRDVDRHAWHLAVAATGPDEQAAGDLERAAGRAAARSGYAAAAAAYERAAQLSGDTAAAIRRLTLACEAAAHGGRPSWARTLAERAYQEAADPVIQARIIGVQAGADFVQGRLRDAHGLLTAGASLIAAKDPSRAFWMLIEALHAAWAAPTDRRLIAETVDHLGGLRLLPGDPLISVAWLARWGTAVTLGRDTRDFPPLDEVMPQARAAGSAIGPRGLIEVASRAFMAAQDEDCAEIAAALVADARGKGMIFALPGGLGLLTLAQTLLGRYRDALVSGTEGLRIARDTGQLLWVSYAAGALAYLAAVKGDDRQCRHHAGEAWLEPMSDTGSLAGATWSQAALALLDLGLGRVQEAFDRLRAIADGPTRHQAAVVRSMPDLIEAAIRLDRPEDARAPLTSYSTWAKVMGQPWIGAVLARCQALTAPDSQAEQLYTRALTLHEHHARPFERARTELAYGEWLRRSKRKNEASAQLRRALQTFEMLGALPWAERARTELDASGTTAARAVTPDAFTDLTPQELQVIRLAAQGKSNRDIAAQLFLSPRTVAYHLYKAYPKLGISSRGELLAHRHITAIRDSGLW